LQDQRPLKQEQGHSVLDASNKQADEVHQAPPRQTLLFDTRQQLSDALSTQSVDGEENQECIDINERFTDVPLHPKSLEVQEFLHQSKSAR
jgi:hypothetical protein